MDMTSAPGRRHRMPEVVKSAVRALEILEFFDRWQGPVSVGTIATDLGYPQSSTSALMRSLVKVGYLSYDAHARTFMPTSRVPLLGSWLGAPFLRGGCVLEVVRELADRTGLAVGIGRRNEGQVQWLHCTASDDVSAAEVFAMPTSLTRDAIGLTLLSALDLRQVQGIVHRVNAYAELDSVVPWPEMSTKISDTRRDGYAFSETGELASLSMLVPITTVDETVAVALIGKGVELREKLPRIVAIMRECMATLREVPNTPDTIMIRGADRDPEVNWRPMPAHA